MSLEINTVWKAVAFPMSRIISTLFSLSPFPSHLPLEMHVTQGRQDWPLGYPLLKGLDGIGCVWCGQKRGNNGAERERMGRDGCSHSCGEGPFVCWRLWAYSALWLNLARGGVSFNTVQLYSISPHLPPGCSKLTGLAASSSAILVLLSSLTISIPSYTELLCFELPPDPFSWVLHRRMSCFSMC